MCSAGNHFLSDFGEGGKSELGQGTIGGGTEPEADGKDDTKCITEIELRSGEEHDSRNEKESSWGKYWTSYY